jgi:spermidine synthase
MRRFTAVFGATSLAATATLSAFFLGSALGSAVLGARAPRWPRPLRAFGFLEIGVGLSALLVRPILHLYAAAYPSFYQALAPFPAAFALVKVLLAMVAVGLPTFFMGGTLPALGEAVTRAGQRLGLPVGGLYAANVAGAALGALAVPFGLLPALGAGRAYAAAIGASLTVGATAVLLGARTSRPAATEAEPAPRRHDAAAATVRTGRPVLALALWSGVATLGLQVLWTRMFSLVHENSVYSFALVVVVFLAGLAGGAALARFGLRRGVAAPRLLAASWSIAGLLVLLSPQLFSRLTGGLEYLPDAGWLSSLGRLLLVGTVTIGPACVSLGMALPLLMEMAGGGPLSAGPLLGRLLAANTAGAIVGPLLVTFVVAPRLGLWNSVALFALVTLLAAERAGYRPARERWGAWSLAAILLLVASPARLPPARIRAENGERLVSVREGSYGTTAVIEDGRDRWITVNNTYVLGGAADADEERWQGHLPLLLHPSPRRVAFIGLGTGITASALRLHPVDQAVALELVPEVVAAARADFPDANLHLFDDPRLVMITDDGRNYLAAAPAPFDVIVGDLLVPWRPAEAALYTREHFQSVRRALAPGGIFCQWLPLYQLTEDQLQVLARTFADVFPSTTVWRGNFLPELPTLALVGQMDATPLDAAGIDARARALAAQAAARSPFLQHPSGLWLRLVGALRADGAWPGPRPWNLDDEPRVELLSARHARPLMADAMEDVMEKIAHGSFDGTPLATLPAAPRAWHATGLALGRASCVRGEKGQRGILTLLRTLPLELQRALGADAPVAP